MGREMKSIWRLSEGGRLYYLLTIICIIFGTIAGYTIPITTQFIIDTVIGGQDATGIAAPIFQYFIDIAGGLEPLRTNILICCSSILVLTLVQGLFNFCKDRFAAKSSEMSAFNLRNRLFSRILHVPFSYYTKSDTGNLIQRCTSDIETVRTFLGAQLVEFTRVMTMVIAVIPVMMMYNGKMTIVASLLLPAIILYSFYYFFRMKKIHATVADSEATMSTVLQESLKGVRVVKAFGKEQFEINKFVEANEKFRDHSLHMIGIVSRYWGISAFLCMLQIGVVLVYGIYSIVQGELMVGEFSSFMAYETMLVWTIRGLGRVLGEMGRALVSFGRITEILDAPVEDYESGQKFPIKGDIEFKNITFGYQQESPCIKNISLKIPAKSTVAFIGKTGSGKSTLVNLIPRIYDATEGTVLIDGRDIHTYNLPWLRSNIGTILQEPFLFSRTIGRNVQAGNELASFEELITATKTSMIHDTIDGFAEKYETEVGERGVTLSGGQKQRLSISRGILKEHPIMIFDDTLSAVDTETDLKIREALAEREHSSTNIIISHRLSSVNHADCIYVIDDGQITESGTHGDLIKLNGEYAKLWQIQQGIE